MEKHIRLGYDLGVACLSAGAMSNEDPKGEEMLALSVLGFGDNANGVISLFAAPPAPTTTHQHNIIIYTII